MAKPTPAVVESEAAIQEELERMEGRELAPDVADNFNIVPGKPLPEGFVNPPCGDAGHFCVDRAGNYNPDWYQVNIQPRTDYDANPQPFPLSQNYLVPLDKWVDVPAEIISSLNGAVEVHHNHNRNPGDILMGEDNEPTAIERKRFLWSQYPSARPRV